MSDYQPDHGDDLGKAFQCRPSAIESVGGEWRGQFKHGSVDARRMQDTTIYDLLFRAGRITEPQYDAADRLYGLWTGGGFVGDTTSGYGQRAGGRTTGDDADGTSADEYRAILRRMPMHFAIYIDALMMMEYRAANLHGIKQALDWCVKEWKL